MNPQRVIFFSGMGADERLFEPQFRHGFDFEVPAFPIPDPQDDMAAYAERVRCEIDLNEPCILGGISFGGMLACELAKIVPARCVLLIASCRQGSAIPSYYQLAEWGSRVLPDRVLQGRAVALGQMFCWAESLDPDQRQLVEDMARDAPIPLLRQIGRMVVKWRSTDPLPCPVHHIHGDVDRLLPIANIAPPPDEIVHGGGHLINMTHTQRVNDFIERHLNHAPP